VNSQELAFLVGLEKLTRETGIMIGGCGCCGSPSLDTATAEELCDESAGYGFGYAGEVTWISRSDEYSWEKFAKSIAKPEMGDVQ
jgi:hypothetical protein